MLSSLAATTFSLLAASTLVFSPASAGQCEAGSCDQGSSASNDSVIVYAVPTEHGKPRAYGGDADSWDVWVGYTASADPVDEQTDPPVFVIASKGCWPESEYFDEYRFFSGDAQIPMSEPVPGYAASCVSDLSDYVDDLYDGQPYLRVDYFNDSGCGELDFVNIMIADGLCHPRAISTDATTFNFEVESRHASISADGTASFAKFASGNCTGKITESLHFTADQIESSACVGNVFASTNGDSGLSGGAIAGIVIGIVVAVALAACAVWFYRRRNTTTSASTADMEAYAKA